MASARPANWIPTTLICWFVGGQALGLPVAHASDNGSGEPEDASALEQKPSTPVGVMTQVEEGPTIDGKLHEPVWKRAVPLDQFTQVEPDEGAEPRERTEVRILYTQDSIFFGIRCYDSQPDRMVARRMRRDQRLPSDDRVRVVLDTFLGAVEADIRFTPDLSWSNLVQYDNVSNQAGLNSRFRWIIEPGKELFVVANQPLHVETARVRALDMELTTKLGWTFRF